MVPTTVRTLGASAMPTVNTSAQVASATTSSTPKIAPNSGTINVSTGDRLLAWQSAEHAGGTFTTAPTKSSGTATIGTFTLPTGAEVGSGTTTCRTKVWSTTVSAGGTLAVSFVRTGTAVAWNAGVVAISSQNGIGAVVGEAIANSVAPDLPITPTGAGSSIFYVESDFNAVAGARTFRQINGSAPTVIQSQVDSGHYGSDVVVYVNAGAASAKNTSNNEPGISSPTTLAEAHVAVEVLSSVTPAQTSVARVGMAPVGTPTSRTLHSLHVRARVQTSATATMRMALYEGLNNRSGDLETSTLTTSLADYTLAIPDAGAAAITDYSALEVRFWGYSSTGDKPVVEVAEVSLELPTSSTAVINVTASDSSTVSDAVSRTSVESRAAATTVAVSDVTTRTSSDARSTSEPTTSVSDSPAVVGSLVRTTVDSTSISDAVVDHAGLVPVVVDSASVSDATSRSSQSLARLAATTVVVSDGADVTSGGTLSRSATDELSVSDATSRGTRSSSRTALDSIATSTDVASSSSVGSATATASDLVMAGDSVVRSSSLARTVGTTLAIGDSAGPMSTSRIAADGFGVSDNATVARKARPTTQIVALSPVGSLSSGEIESSPA